MSQEEDVWKDCGIDTSLVFGAVNSDRVDFGTNFDNLDPWSVVMWGVPTTLTAGRALFGHGTPAAGGSRREFAVVGSSTAEISAIVDRATTDGNYITSSSPLVVNVDAFYAVVFDSAAAAGELYNIYKGGLGAASAEVTYGTTTDGSGALGDDSAQSFFAGNNVTLTAAFQGRISFMALFNTALSAATVERYRQWPYLAMSDAGLQGAWSFGAVVFDWGKRTNNGTITGATAGVHVPIIDSPQLLNAAGCA